MDDKKFIVKTINDKDAITVEFSGNLIINYINDIKLSVEKLNVFNSNINVKLTRVDNIDFTFIQLLLSIKKTLETKKYSFSISSELNEDMSNLLINAGFNKLMNSNIN